MRPFRVVRFAVWPWFFLAVPFIASACNKGGDSNTERAAPPPPPSAGPAPGSARPDVCAGGGGHNSDPISGPFVVRAEGGFCLDPQGEPKTYGDQGKLSMDDVCTTAFDGECEVYKRFGLDRVVVLRYVDGSGAPNSVEVNLSRFKTADGAYGMFTKRVVADGDPARATVKPLDAGAVGAASSSNAYVWRGPYLVELTFVTEDTKMTAEAMAHANEVSTEAIAKAIGSHLPGSPDLLPAAARLPTASRIPLGIAYYPKDALGIAGVGPLAVGYFKEGEARWRSISLVRDSVDAAKEAFRAFKGHAGSVPLKGFGDEAVQVVLQEAADRARAEYVVARNGNVISGIGDEELVLEPGAPAEKLAALKLPREDKKQRLSAWMASDVAPAVHSHP